MGTSELLDAFAVLREIPWTAQGEFREALAATLAKSQEDRRTFELVFDRFFFRAVEMAAVREGAEQDGGSLHLRDCGALGNRTRRAATPDSGRLARRGRGRDARSGAHGDRDVRPAGAGVGGDRGGRAAHPQSAGPAHRAPAGAARGRPAPRGRAAGRAAPLRGIDAQGAGTRAGPALGAPAARRARLGELDRALPSGPLQDLAAVHRVVAQLRRRLATQGKQNRGTATTPTWTCGARCERRCRRGACPSSCATARAGPGARRSTCCATSPRA